MKYFFIHFQSLNTNRQTNTKFLTQTLIVNNKGKSLNPIHGRGAILAPFSDIVSHFLTGKSTALKLFDFS